ncbi:MAG: hypothetical protein U0Q22_17035 [Acidimicrobiales bacterium]
MRHLRLLLPALFAALVLTVVHALPAGAEAYDTTDDAMTVTPPAAGFVPGAAITVTATGFQAGSTAQAYVHSDPVYLGSLTANSIGTVSGSFALPATLAAGDHHVELHGTDPSGNPRVLSYAITVSSAARPDALSFTGSTAIPVAVAGVVLTGLGLTVLRFGRRRSGAAAA